MKDFLANYRLSKYENPIKDEGKNKRKIFGLVGLVQSFRFSGFELLEDLSEATEKDVRELGESLEMKRGEMFVYFLLIFKKIDIFAEFEKKFFSDFFKNFLLF